MLWLTGWNLLLGSRLLSWQVSTRVKAAWSPDIKRVRRFLLDEEFSDFVIDHRLRLSGFRCESGLCLHLNIVFECIWPSEYLKKQVFWLVTYLDGVRDKAGSPWFIDARLRCWISFGILEFQVNQFCKVLLVALQPKQIRKFLLKFELFCLLQKSEQLKLLILLYNMLYLIFQKLIFNLELAHLHFLVLQLYLRKVSFWLSRNRDHRVQSLLEFHLQ